MQFTATAKQLVSALTIVRKGAIVVTDTIKDGRIDKSWLDRPAHTYGYDRVIICVDANGVSLLTTNAADAGKSYFHEWDEEAMVTWNHAWHMEGSTSTIARLETTSVNGAGSVAVPIRVLHDYVKTFGLRDELTITCSDTQVTITHERSRANIVATPVDALKNGMVFAGMTPNVRHIASTPNIVKLPPTPTEQRAAAEREQEAYYETMTGQTCNWFPRAMHGPAFVPPRDTHGCVILPPGTIVPDSGPILQCIIDLVCKLPELPNPPAPTPIYQPVVGEHVHIMLSHDNGTTTERVILVHRVRLDDAGNVDYFRGFDVRRNRTRNFDMQHVLWLRKWDGKEITDMTGRVLVPAA